MRENDFILDIHLDGNPFGDAGCQAWDTGRSVGWGLALVVRAEAREQIRERCRANQEAPLGWGDGEEAEHRRRRTTGHPFLRERDCGIDIQHSV